jgi:hypothetical protein
MKKLVYTLIALMVLTVFMVGCTIVVPETDLSGKGPNGQAGNSNIAHLYLYEKDPDTWIIKEDGAWGKMKYNLSGEMFEFVFNGHGLEAGSDYTLIYYPDPWPGNGLICLGSGTANKGGEVHIAESPEIDFLPVVLDDNFPVGAKIWLVLTEDVDCISEPTNMVGWQPTEYLFEDDLIQFNEGDQFISDEFTFSGNDNSVPNVVLNNETCFNDETNTLTIDGDALTNYYLHILEGPELMPGKYGLYLVNYNGTGDLMDYYDSKPDPWKTYLLGALDGNNPFAYIQGGSTPPLLLDAAKFDLFSWEEAMTIPGDYPEGEYTVAGKVDTSDGWKAVTFVLVINR